MLKDGDPDVVGSDYINANHIDGEDEPGAIFPEADHKKYLATQGCMPNTISDFWRMVWQENVGVIVMTTKEVERGKNKCARYWPECEATKEIKSHTLNIVVKNIQETTTSDYTLREFIVSAKRNDDSDSKEEYHKVFQYHFKVWPDHGVPNDPGCVLNFLHDVNKRQESLIQEAPSPSTLYRTTLVHCSAGIGRTGTFIVIDIILNQITRQGLDCEIDIQKTIQLVRSQRSGMVQTEAQYKFVYMAVQHYIDTVSQRLQAKQNSQKTGRDYTNIKCAAEALGCGDPPNSLPALSSPIPLAPPRHKHKELPKIPPELYQNLGPFSKDKHHGKK
ncbi:unnamed protein product [Owenia fusiformis]|uniref:Uncharacterized protein n=1 Tax=Owenia fusiformis TaxID=6347 RepID=A0A8S4N4R5_OWEFU|nr:unnamed protein product [Owenia fusiformis]